MVAPSAAGSWIVNSSCTSRATRAGHHADLQATATSARTVAQLVEPAIAVLLEPPRQRDRDLLERMVDDLVGPDRTRPDRALRCDRSSRTVSSYAIFKTALIALPQRFQISTPPACQLCLKKSFQSARNPSHFI